MSYRTEIVGGVPVITSTQVKHPLIHTNGNVWNPEDIAQSLTVSQKNDGHNGNQTALVWPSTAQSLYYRVLYNDFSFTH